MQQMGGAIPLVRGFSLGKIAAVAAIGRPGAISRTDLQLFLLLLDERDEGVRIEANGR
jgi:hypothetical protein